MTPPWHDMARKKSSPDLIFPGDKIYESIHKTTCGKQKISLLPILSGSEDSTA